MRFCSKKQYQLFLKQVAQLENMLIEDGIRIIKLWFSIDIKEQKRRLEDRKINPLKQWKLSTIDMQAQLKWDDYPHHKLEMFKYTDTKISPWINNRGNHKNKARKETMRYVLNSVPYTQRGSTGECLEPDADIVSMLSN